MGRTVRDLLAALLCAGILAGCLEASLHIWRVRLEGSLYSKDPLRRFRLRPNAHGWSTEEVVNEVRINSAGYHDAERSKAKPPGVFRVAVVGDSTVAALQVAWEKAFPHVAETILAHGKRVEFLNFGTPNYGLAQQYLTLRDEVPAYRPDLVLEAVSLSNAILNSTRATRINDSPYPYLVRRGGALAVDTSGAGAFDAAAVARENRWLDFENECELCLAVNQARRGFESWYGNIVRKRHADPYAVWTPQVWAPPRNPEMEQTWRISEDTLALMKRECAARKIPFWVMAMDMPEQVNPDVAPREDLHYPDDRICRAAASVQIPCIETARTLAALAVHTGQPLHGFAGTTRNQGHLNEAGHAAVGRILADWVARDGFH